MKLFKVFSMVLFLLLSAELAASTRIRVDLDTKTTEIVRAELGVDDHYYYIDPNACICWVSRLIGGANSTSTFDCLKLLSYQKLEHHLKKCKEVKEVKEVKEEPKPVEIRNEDKD